MNFFKDKEWENWFTSTCGRSKKTLKKSEKIIDHVSTSPQSETPICLENFFQKWDTLLFT